LLFLLNAISEIIEFSRIVGITEMIL